MMPPVVLYLRMMQETAGVDSIPPWPINNLLTWNIVQCHVYYENNCALLRLLVE